MAYSEVLIGNKAIIMKKDESGFILASATQTDAEQPLIPPANAATTEQPSPASAPGQWRRILALVIGYLLLYFGAFRAVALLDQGGLIASLWYPPAGLTVFGMLAFGWARVALDATGSFLTLLLPAAAGGAPVSGSCVVLDILPALKDGDSSVER
jgi:hypothetical protein